MALCISHIFFKHHHHGVFHFPPRSQTRTRTKRARRLELSQCCFCQVSEMRRLLLLPQPWREHRPQTVLDLPLRFLYSERDETFPRVFITAVTRTWSFRSKTNNTVAGCNGDVECITRGMRDSGQNWRCVRGSRHHGDRRDIPMPVG